ncbi:MAG: phage holin family protein [bacterium]|nr:phage holin family protein [bacterium]
MKLFLKPLIGIVLNGLVLYLLTRVVGDITYTGGLKFFVLGGIFLGLFNFFVKPLIKILQLPAMFIFGGLVLIVVNVGILYFLSYFLMVAEFQNVTLHFPNIQTYVIGSVVFGVINWALHLIN